MRLLNDPIFMDIEASSLDSGSFPIEIAWVDSSGHGESYLISPRFNWKGWSAASEKLHGISQSMLDSEGIPATTAAQLVYDTLHDRLIYSDNAAFDAYWLGMLLDLIGQPPLEVKEFDKLRTQELDRLSSTGRDRDSQTLLEKGRQHVAEVDAQEAIRLRTHHRALPDADSLWRRWHAVSVWVDRQLRAS